MVSIPELRVALLALHCVHSVTHMNAAILPAPIGRSPFGPLLLAAAVLGVAGCASYTEVKVDSLAKPNAEQVVSYEIHNKNPLVADDSLRYKEASGYVKTALSGKGLYEAPANTKPDLVVDLDYGIGPPQTKMETVSE